VRAHAALNSGDVATAREILVAVGNSRRDKRPAERSLETLFPEIWLWTQLRDTARAVAVLDSTLHELRWIAPGGLSYVEQAASLVHAMALRAEIAYAAKQTADATRWANAVATLWKDADPGLQRVAARMRSLADR
jgi:hypothetical protein